MMTAQSGFYNADQNVSTDPTRQRHATNQKDVGLEKGPDKEKVSNDSTPPGDACEKVREHFNSLAVTVTSAEIHFSKEQSTMPSDSMDDIELKSVAMQAAAGRRFSRPDVQEVRVETDRGSLLVAVQGNTKKPAILTYHDIGLNYIANFQAFFNYPEMRVLAENFCIYHVNAPGQEEGAAPLPEDYEYPTMDELASQINFVLGHFGLKYVVGIGVGAGGNILARYALAYPTKVESLVLINVSSTQSGWIEWGYQKLNARHLRSKGMTQPVLDYLMWHHFGRGTEERNQDLVFMYKEYFEKCVQPGNLALFIDSYIRRSDLNMQRSTEPNKKSTLTMPVMNITGAFSPHIEDTVTLNSRLDPVNSTWMKLSDCGMVLEEQPGKVTEALRLFLQGLGYVVRLGRKRIASVPSVSMEGDLKQSDSKESVKSSPWPIRITENPISVVC